MSRLYANRDGNSKQYQHQQNQFFIAPILEARKNIIENDILLKSTNEKEVSPVYIQMHEEITEIQFAIGAAGINKYTAEIINLSQEVNFIQKKLLQLGLLSNSNYELEAAAPTIAIETSPQAKEAEIPVSLTQVEKKFMDVYGKIPQNTSRYDTQEIPHTIEGLSSYINKK